jgi:prepilin-type N-terminal cleavage/methylation domain-containing protein
MSYEILNCTANGMASDLLKSADTEQGLHRQGLGSGSPDRRNQATERRSKTVNIRKNNQGFTLIELLIVVVIIGILAAIAIPRFSSTKGKAFDAAAKTDLRNAMTAQEAYYSDNQTYADDEADLDYTATTNVTLNVASGSTSGYEMTAKHSATGTNTWCINSTAGEITKATDC